MHIKKSGKRFQHLNPQKFRDLENAFLPVLMCSYAKLGYIGTVPLVQPFTSRYSCYVTPGLVLLLHFKIKQAHILYTNLSDNIKGLLDLGANPNSCDYDGRCAIHLAAAEGQKEVLYLLIR